VFAGPVTLLIAGYFLAARYFARRVSAGEESHRVSLRPIYAYCLPVSAMLISFTILTNSDVTLVKKFFSPLEAGYYSVAQMVGKIILFFRERFPLWCSPRPPRPMPAVPRAPIY